MARRGTRVGGGGSGGGEDAVDRLVGRFLAEVEGLEVERQDDVGASVVGHAPGLLGGAVEADPRVVRADGHEGEFGSADVAEEIGVGGVAGEEDAARRRLVNDVAVVAAPGVGAHAGAPVDPTWMPRMVAGPTRTSSPQPTSWTRR